ncbi:hypothetical protein [Sphingobacterium litopenaei]|uniref:Uncharacterized protein n=1 Tax=Sphingobacterium litopenaei TaxID=2763500 RepID=A0ABR7YHJ3_9SPHI|nr:hypothetical protein [Sphingobacterium litopenaei]MBD1430762.1 hypothetical protein [Sphingobacterium litopenaei]
MPVPTIGSSGVQIISLPATRIITKDTIATFEIANLLINSTRKPLTLTGFHIKPGVRYKLKIEIGCPCTQEVKSSGYIEISSWNGTKPTTYNTVHTFSSADYGAVLDIFEIDNSFSLRVGVSSTGNGGNHIYSGTYVETSPNSTTVTTNEIQFQGWADNLRDVVSTGLFPNIEFKNGWRWGATIHNQFVPNIFSLKGRHKANTVANGADVLLTDKSEWKPIIRVIINKDGSVEMLGSINAYGGPPYYPLKTTNNVTLTLSHNSASPTSRTRKINGSFNKVTWSRTGVNRVMLDQTKIGSTLFYGKFTGLKTIACSGNQ